MITVTKFTAMALSPPLRHRTARRHQEVEVRDFFVKTRIVLTVACSSSVSGWVITLVIIPMAIAVGVVLTIFGPVLLQRFRGGRYQEFRDFSEVS